MPIAGRKPWACLAALLFLGFTLASSAAAEPAGKRIALVIGNSAYKHAAELKNPGNDANAIAETLTSLGFKVVKGIDLDYAGLARTVRDFSREIDGAETALFYYAGHGLQVGGTNYLVPVDAKLAQEVDLTFETVQLDAVLSLMSRAKGAKIVLLDACRDNPLASTLARSLSATRTIGIGKGLANVKAETGMYIAFATEPGNVAFDGDGKHSPFTEALLKFIGKPDIDLQVMMRLVRTDVIRNTGKRQTPWESSSLTTAFLFKETPKPAPVAVPVAVPKPEPPKAPELPIVSRDQQMILAWQATQAIGTCGSYERFRKGYPDTVLAGLAEEWMRGRCKDGKPIETAAPVTPPPKVEPSPPKTVAVPPPPPPKAIEAKPKEEPKDTKSVRSQTKQTRSKEEESKEARTKPPAETNTSNKTPKVDCSTYGPPSSWNFYKRPAGC